ncbi:hypothetical protein Tco_0604806 [Tanacetum coccineum]
MELLDTGIIYPIADSPWVSPIHCVPKKGGITVVTNENDELVSTRTITGWRVCIDYRKFNEATAKDHFPLPFIDQMLERLAGNKHFYFLNGFYGYFQISIDPMDQEKTTFTCPFGTYAYRKKCHFMVKEGIMLGHKVSGAELEVDNAKIDVISKLPPLPISKLLEKDTSFEFDDECRKAFELLKEKLTCAPVIHRVYQPSSAVTYTSVYTDSEPGRSVAPPTSDYIPDSESHDPPSTKDEDEREPMMSIEFRLEEQPLPPYLNFSPNAEAPGRHLASRTSTVIVPTIELVSPPEGTEPVIPPPSTDITTTGARITVRLQASISLPPEAEVSRLP